MNQFGLVWRVVEAGMGSLESVKMWRPVELVDANIYLDMKEEARAVARRRAELAAQLNNKRR